VNDFTRFRGGPLLCHRFRAGSSFSDSSLDEGSVLSDESSSELENSPCCVDELPDETSVTEGGRSDRLPPFAEMNCETAVDNVFVVSVWPLSSEILSGDLFVPFFFQSTRLSFTMEVGLDERGLELSTVDVDPAL